MRDSPEAPGSETNEGVVVATHLEIEMPDRASAFQLEDHLKALYPLAVRHRGVWHVELDLAEDSEVAEALRGTRDWARTHECEPVAVNIS
jgi:hypothetical protein